MSEKELLSQGFIYIGTNHRNLKTYLKFDLEDDRVIFHKIKDGFSLGVEFFEISSVLLISEFLKSFEK